MKKTKKAGSRKTRSSRQNPKRTFVLVGVLFVILFFVIGAAKTEQVLLQHAQTGTGGVACSSSGGLCTFSGSCQQFETNIGQSDCGSGGICCVNQLNQPPSGTPAATNPVPSAGCLGPNGCIVAPTSAAPTVPVSMLPTATATPNPTLIPTTVQPSASAMPSPTLTIMPTSAPSNNPTGVSPTPGSVISQVPGVSSTPQPTPGGGNNSLINLINQLINLINKLINDLRGLLGGGGKNNNGGSNNSHGSHGGITQPHSGTDNDASGEPNEK